MSPADQSNCCHMPEPAPPAEDKVYTQIRDLLLEAHCARSAGAHQCCGQITLARGSITLDCRLCGSSRQILGGEAEAVRDDEQFYQEYKRAYNNQSDHDMARLLSGRLRAMDRRARAANQRRDEVEAENRRLRGEILHLRATREGTIP